MVIKKIVLFTLMMGMHLSLHPSNAPQTHSNHLGTILGIGLIAGSTICTYKAIRYLGAAKRKKKRIEKTEALYHAEHEKLGKSIEANNHLLHNQEMFFDIANPENDISQDVYVKAVIQAAAAVYPENTANILAIGSAQYFKHSPEIQRLYPTRVSSELPERIPNCDDASKQVAFQYHCYLVKCLDDFQKDNAKLSASQAKIKAGLDTHILLIKSSEKKSAAQNITYKKRAIKWGSAGALGLATGLALLWPRKSN